MLKQNQLFFILSIALLTGCQSFQGPLDKNNPTYLVPPGSMLELNQPLAVYPGYSRSFIQGGQSVKFNEVNQRYPWCQFRLYEPPEALETKRQIQPDRFLVIRSYRVPEPSAAVPRLLASSLLISNILRDDRPDLDLSSIMQISSKQQPQVIEFKCSIFADPVTDDYVTINEMQQALGDVVTLQLAE